MNTSDLENMINGMKATERDAVEVTAESVISAVKAAGAISLMPNASLPLTGLLMLVHPKVYDRIQKMKLEAATE